MLSIKIKAISQNFENLSKNTYYHFFSKNFSKRRPYEVLNRHDFHQVDEGKMKGIFETLESGAKRQWYFFNDVHTYDDKIEFEVASERGLKRVMKLGFHDVFKMIGT